MIAKFHFGFVPYVEFEKSRFFVGFTTFFHRFSELSRGRLWPKMRLRRVGFASSRGPSWPKLAANRNFEGPREAQLGPRGSMKATSGRHYGAEGSQEGSDKVPGGRKRL